MSANVNALLVGIGPLWLSENNYVPVSLLDGSNNWVTGMPASGVTVLYHRQGDATNQTFSPTNGTQWIEKGHGMYDLVFPSSIINQPGIFMYSVEPVAALGYQNFRASGYIDSRPEARVWNAAASGYNTSSTMGALENNAGNYVEVFAGASYNKTGQTLTFCVAAQLNGSLILTPTSCRVTMIDQNGSTICDLTNASPNGGFFIVQQTSLVLSAQLVYSIRVRVTYNGVEYSSVETGQSFS